MSKITIKGDTSGEVHIEAPAVAGNTTYNLSTAGGNILASGDIGSTVQGYDATILKSADIGTSVQAHDANTAKYNDTTANFTGTLQTGGNQVATQNALGVRNLIINGDMRIAQRGTNVTGISNSAEYRTVDRWKFAQQSATGVFTMSQDTDVPAGQGFTYSVKMQCTTADTTLDANDRIAIWQGIEGNMLQSYIKGTNATKATLSFWVKSNKTGTYNLELNDTDNIRHICNTFTVDTANTWQKITWVIDADTGGNPFDNGVNGGMYVNIVFGAGSNYQSGTLATTWSTPVTQGNRYVGASNLADSTSNYINITGIQLEVGTEATPFEHRPYDMELARCQRYYWKMSAVEAYGPYGMGHGVNVSNFRVIIHTPQTMRAYPSLGFSAASTFIWSFGNVLSSIVPAEYSSNAFSVNCQATGISANGGYLLTAGNNATSYIEAIAEL